MFRIDSGLKVFLHRDAVDGRKNINGLALLLTEAALAWVATSKYQDSLPLYRQAALIGRFGGDLSRNTLAGGMVKVGEEVQAVCKDPVCSNSSRNAWAGSERILLRKCTTLHGCLSGNPPHVAVAA